MIELGLLDIQGINEACNIALFNYENIKLELSPKYKENNLKLNFDNNIYSVGGQSDGYKKVIIDITDVYKTHKIYIYLENLELNEY